MPSKKRSYIEALQEETASILEAAREYDIDLTSEKDLTKDQLYSMTRNFQKRNQQLEEQLNEALDQNMAFEAEKKALQKQLAESFPTDEWEAKLNQVHQERDDVLIENQQLQEQLSQLQAELKAHQEAADSSHHNIHEALRQANTLRIVSSMRCKNGRSVGYRQSNLGRDREHQLVHTLEQFVSSNGQMERQGIFNFAVILTSDIVQHLVNNEELQEEIGKVEDQGQAILAVLLIGILKICGIPIPEDYKD